MLWWILGALGVTYFITRGRATKLTLIPLQPDALKNLNVSPHVLANDYIRKATAAFPELRVRENYEKYSDTRYPCFGSHYKLDPAKADRYLIPHKLGHEYLAGAPPKARERIELISAYIQQHGNDDPGNIVTAYTKGSIQALDIMALDLVQKYRTKEGREQLASMLKTNIESINADATKVLKLAEQLTGTDLTRALINELTQRFVDYLTKTVSAIAGSAMGSAFTKSVPLLGQMLSAVLDAMNAVVSAREHEWRAKCQEYMDSQIRPVVDQTVSYGFPLPFHLFDQIHPDCPEPKTLGGVAPGAERWVPGNLAILADLLKHNFDSFRRLPVTSQADIREWWALTMSLFADPLIKKTFTALGWGSWASDEQVLMVAYPMAVAYGLNPDAFAIALWKLADGWSGMPESTWRKKNYDQFIQTSKGFDVRPGICPPTTDNGYWLNFADLTSKAFKLAAALGKRPK